MKRIDFTNPEDRQLRIFTLNDGLADGSTVSEPNLGFCLLQDKHLRGARFKGGRIEHCRFEHCNLRNARFDDVDLTATRFFECNLRHVAFTNCQLRYVTFHGCQLDYDKVLSSVPEDLNLRRDVLRSLRGNALSLGDATQAEKLLGLELIAERRDLWKRFVAKEKYYRDRSSRRSRASAAFGWLSWWISQFLWGHGRALWRLFVSGATVIAIFAALCWGTSAEYRFEGYGGMRRLQPIEALYYSVMAFTTGGFGDIMPGNGIARLLTSTEGLLGVVFLGFFAATAYRRLAR